MATTDAPDDDYAASGFVHYMDRPGYAAGQADRDAAWAAANKKYKGR